MVLESHGETHCQNFWQKWFREQFVTTLIMQSSYASDFIQCPNDV